jgi:pimeloyl-ACP methyl ester carboxylesterase
LIFQIVFFLFLVNSIPALADDENTSGVYREESCNLTGLNRKTRCFSFASPSNENLLLKGVIVSSAAVVPESDPFVVLAGGPGQAATDLPTMLMAAFSEISETRDIIFFDILGTGLSEPVGCDVDFIELPPLTNIEIDLVSSQVRACYQRDGGILKNMSTRTIVEDLEHLRSSLGVTQWNIWGGSYGTRLAQYYALIYPEHVRSVILDAVVPFYPSYVSSQPKNATDVLSRVSNDCLNNKECAKAFPDFDAMALLDMIKDNQPIEYRHPITNQKIITNTSRDVVAQTIFQALYAPESRVIIPYALTEAVLNENWAPLAVLGTDISQYLGRKAIYIGAYLAITCAEEKPRVRLNATDGDYLVSHDMLLQSMAVCDLWPTKPAQMPQPEQGAIAVPALLISGGYDPITPPSFAETASKYFKHSYHYVLENGGHINSDELCIANFLNEFVVSPNDPSLCRRADECQPEGGAK